MNILEAFNQGLPEITGGSSRKSYLKLDPRVIHKEHFELGEWLTLVKMPGADNYVRLTREQWIMVQLFDGTRSYEEVAELLPERAGVAYSVDDIKEFMSAIDDSAQLLYKTPLEKNITLKQKLGASRFKRKRFSFKDVTEITLYRWPHADDYITTLHPYLRFFYTKTCTAITLVCFAIMVWMWADKLGTIWRDSFEFYNFTAKGFTDLVEFWVLFGAMAFFHETAHGMTCKHFGGGVEKIEFILMYFSPAFICDVTQIWIVGERIARIYTIIAGLWFDLILCFFATVIWWTTAPGMAIHDFAYKIMMVTGLGVTLLNLNPLIKLDGYYLFSELIRDSDLHERSKSYLSEWIRKHVWRLPVEVEYVPIRKRRLYIIYAILSITYGVLLMGFTALFLYHIMRRFSPEYAWIPGLWVAFLIFRSRLRKLVRLMKDIYLDKKDRVRMWFTPARLAGCSLLLLFVLFAPLWPDFVEGKFVIESANRTVIRAEVPGVITDVLVSENQHVAPGTSLIRLRNLDLESEAARANARMHEASARATTAALRYADFGPADRERQESAAQARILSGRLSELELKSSIHGVVLTSRLHDKVGEYVEAGSEVAEVADLSSMRARIYIPEFVVRDVHVGSSARLHVGSRLTPVSGTLAELQPTSSTIDPTLTEKEQLSGIVPPPFYVGLVNLQNDGFLAEGMTGTAKILVRRRSPAEMLGRFVRDLVERRLW